MKLDKSFVINSKQYLDATCAGQEQYKRRLIMKVFNFINNNDRSPIMIIGPTGNGKSYILSRLMEYIKDYVNTSIYEVSRITQSGFSGPDIDEVFKQHKSQNYSTTKKNIIMLDEIDKLLEPSYDSQGENWHALLQKQIMNILDGSVNIEHIDTSKVLFILCGAFTKLEEIENSSSHKIGFGESESLNTYDNTIRENLQKIGVEREFLGRITSIVKINRLDRKMLTAILMHPKLGEIARRKQQFHDEGLELEVEKNMIDAIIDKIEAEDLGARSARNILDEIINDSEFEMIAGEYNKMILHTGCLNGEPPKLIKQNVIH